jgi:hypothetical protein
MLTTKSLMEQGLIQDDNFPTLFTKEDSVLDFKLTDQNKVLVGFDLEYDPQILFVIHSKLHLQSFFNSVDFSYKE